MISDSCAAFVTAYFFKMALQKKAEESRKDRMRFSSGNVEEKAVYSHRMEMIMEWRHSKAVAFAMDILLQEHRDAAEKLILNAVPLPESQAYQITSDTQHITVSAGDEAGMMYALLDLAEIWESKFPADLKINV